MVDQVRLARLLRQITDIADFLQSETEVGVEVRAQRRWLDSIKYNFVASIECCVDVGQHICAVRGWGPPENNADVFRLMASHGVIGPQLAGRLVAASGFRNVLVHEYVTVRDDLVVANLDRLSDLRDFVRAIAGWLASGSD